MAKIPTGWQVRLRAKGMAAADRLRRAAGRPRDPYPMPRPARLHEAAGGRLMLSPSQSQASMLADPPLALARRRRVPDGDPAALAAWQAEARARLAMLLHLPPAHRAHPAVVADDDPVEIGPDLARRTLYLRAAPGRDLPVTLVWSQATQPSGDPSVPGPPVLLYQAGSGSGVHLAYGEVRRPADIERLAIGADMGLQAAARGWLAVCVEQFGFGDRRERDRLPLTPGLKTGDAFAAGLLVGRNLVGERVSDLMAVTDWLVGDGRGAGGLRQDAGLAGDPSRLAVFGHSSGGTSAFYAAAADLRIGCCVASGCLGFVRDTLAVRRNGDGDAVVPSLLAWFEIDDVLALIAPRPLLAITGRHDHIWPAAGMTALLDSAATAWRTLDALPPRAVVGAGGHRPYPDETWALLDEACPFAPTEGR